MQVRWQRLGEGLEKAVLVDGGREASWLHFESQRIRIGRAPVRAGIVGHVFTLEERRGRGLGRVVMEEALRHMEARRHDIAFLFGIPHYYRKFGYTTVHHYYATVLDLWRSRPERVAGFRLRHYRPEDLPTLMRLYGRDNALRTGAFARSRAYWTRGAAARRMDTCTCCHDARGRLAGYAKWGGTLFHARLMAPDVMERALVVAEAAAADAPAAAALLGELARIAEREGRSALVFTGPPDHALSAAMYALGGQQRRGLVPAGGVQARIVRLMPLMGKLAAEFSRLYRRSALRGRRAAAAIRTPMGGVRLRADGREVHVEPTGGAGLEMSPQDLIEHLFGYRPPPEAPGEAGLLLRTLLPERIAHAWPLDEPE
jgi:hypothetical protein